MSWATCPARNRAAAVAADVDESDADVTWLMATMRWNPCYGASWPPMSADQPLAAAAAAGTVEAVAAAAMSMSCMVSDRAVVSYLTR